MANRNNSKPAAAPAAAPAKAPMALRAAALVAKGGLAAHARIAAATQAAPQSAKRYGAALNKPLSTGFANTVFTLTPQGAKVIGGHWGKPGATPYGNVTAMGLTVLAFGAAANGGQTATGAAIVAAMLGNPAIVAALQGTKANGGHVQANAPLCANFVQGYVNGMCRAQHGYATK